MSDRNLNGYDPGRRKFLRDAGMLLGSVLIGSSIPDLSFSYGSKKEGLSQDATYSEIVDYLRNNREPVDYEKIWPHEVPVLFAGEKHTALGHKEEIIRQIPFLKGKGMTHLAMEQLMEEDQPIVDGYFNGTVEKGKILEKCKSSWDTAKKNQTQKYMDLVDSARGNGIRVLAIDLPIPKNEDIGSTIFRRNSNWVKIIRNNIEKEPESRVLVYCGAVHCGYNKFHDTADETLHIEGIASKVLDFAGAGTPAHGYSFYDRIAKAAQDLKIDKERFCLTIDSGSPTYRADYIIHLPQMEKDEYNS